MGDASTDNFLRQFRDPDTLKIKNLTAAQFAEVWNHYDADGNGYIEGRELDNFLRQLVFSVVKCGVEAVSDTAFKVMFQEFMDAFDLNEDNRIDITEISHILPADENFLLLFRRDNPLESSVEFMRVWRKFDLDRSGYIEANELKAFITTFLREAKPEADFSEAVIIEYTDHVLNLFDRNHDGKLQLSEMARLLPIKENFLCRPIFKNASKITSCDVDRVFNLYDRDRNGFIENDELQGFLKDLLELVQEDYDIDDFSFFMQVILKQWDVDHDGKICRNELKMILLQQSKLNEKEIIQRPS